MTVIRRFSTLGILISQEYLDFVNRYMPDVTQTTSRERGHKVGTLFWMVHKTRKFSPVRSKKKSVQ